MLPKSTGALIKGQPLGDHNSGTKV
uniref:Uncharacterized protein n=1 Tax=Rhodnius prolixus TaxID=13249 RepID=T1IBZ4_RHOPR